MSITSFAPLTPPESAPAAARAVFRLMKGLKHGTLSVQVPDGSTVLFGSPGEGGLRAAVRLRNWKVDRKSVV